MGIYLETDAEDNPENPTIHSEPVKGLGKGSSDLEFIFQQRALFTSNIHLADQKSGYIAILHGVLISGISSLMQNNEIVIKFSSNMDRWLYVCTMVTLFVSFGANMLAFIPRARSSTPRDHSWTGITDGDPDAIVRAIIAESQLTRMKRITSQVQALAEICNHKFKYIKHSITFLGVSMTSGIILYVRLVLT